MILVSMIWCGGCTSTEPARGARRSAQTARATELTMRTTIILPFAVVVACGGGERAPAADTTTTVTPAAATTPQKIATAEGFSTPESVVYDSDQRVWFVSNINGSPSAKDGNGF